MMTISSQCRNHFLIGMTEKITEQSKYSKWVIKNGVYTVLWMWGFAQSANSGDKSDDVENVSGSGENDVGNDSSGESCNDDDDSC
jgi:hypothetical protein